MNCKWPAGCSLKAIAPGLYCSAHAKESLKLTDGFEGFEHGYEVIGTVKAGKKLDFDLKDMPKSEIDSDKGPH